MVLYYREFYPDPPLSAIQVKPTLLPLLDPPAPGHSPCRQTLACSTLLGRYFGLNAIAGQLVFLSFYLTKK